MTQISIRQINQSELFSFITNSISGGGFSGILTDYLAHSGYLGNLVVYTSGGDQLIFGTKTFTNNPELNYTGTTGSAISRGAVLNILSGSLLSLSGANGNMYVLLNGNNIIGGVNTFTGQLSVPSATATGNAVNLADLARVSGILAAGISNVTISNVVTTTGNELIGGSKTFTGSPNVAMATTPSGAVNLGLLVGVSGVLLQNMAILSGLLVAGGGSGVQASNTFFAGSSVSGATAVPTFRGLAGADFGLSLSIALSGLSVGYNGLLTGFAGAVAAVNFAGSSVTNGAGFGLYRYAASAGGVSILSHKSRGTTIGTHGATLNNDVLYDFNIAGSDGTGWVRSARMYVQATSIYSGGTGGASFNFATTDIFGTHAFVAAIDSSGINTVKPITINATPTLPSHAARLSDLQTVSNVEFPFFFDQYNLSTGLNVIEGFTARGFTFSGYLLGVINTGTQGFLSGSAYQRTSTNVKTTFLNFSLAAGQGYYISGGFNQPITGTNRVGIDIYLIGTGITGLSISLLGS